MKKALSLLLVAALLLGILAGCGDKSTPQPAAEVATASEPAAEPAAKKKAVVRTTMTLMPKIDPAVGSDVAASAVILNLYDSLVYPTADGNVKPCIATSWTTSEDGLVWTFTIRDDVVFHSGNKLTAHDVAYSMNRLLTLGTGYAFLFKGVVESAEALDDTTFVITCSKTYGPLLSALIRLYIVDSKLLSENYADGSFGEMGDYGQAYLLTHDAGSGAYYLSDYSQDVSVTGTVFADYWMGVPENSPEEFIVYASNEAVTVKTMMSRQELEISDQWQSAESIASISQLPGVELISNTTGQMVSLWVNNQKAPTDCPHFRKAIAYLIDYSVLTTVIYPGATQNNCPISPVLLGASPVYNFSNNLEMAKAELAQSKYADSYGTFEVEFGWGSGTPDREKIALMVQAAGQQIGLNIKVIQQPWTTTIEAASKMETTPNIFILSLTPQCSDGGIQLNTLLHTGTPTWEKMSWVNDPILDAMIEDALMIVDPAERAAAYVKIQEYLKDICPMISLVLQPERLCYQASYMEFNPTIPIQGYSFVMRDIKVYPERMAAK